jgi:hypothetical protein
MVPTIRRTAHLVALTNLRPADAYPKHHARLHPNDGINGLAPSARVNDLCHRSSSSSDYIPNCKSTPKRDTLIPDSPRICRSSRHQTMTCNLCRLYHIFVGSRLLRSQCFSNDNCHKPHCTDGSTAKVEPAILSREVSYGFPSVSP